MRKIDKDRLIKKDRNNVAQSNFECYMKALNDRRKGLYLGGLRDECLFEFYGEKQNLYNVVYELLDLLINEECDLFHKMEDVQPSLSTDNDIAVFNFKLLERGLRGEELTQQEEIEECILIPIKNEKNFEEMTDEEIYMRYIKVMHDKKIKALKEQYPNYNLNSDDELERLYFETYDNLSTAMVQFAFDINRMSAINQLVEYHNILAENNTDKCIEKNEEN